MKMIQINRIKKMLSRSLPSIFRSCCNEEECGIALLMTLGILAIMIVLAVAFASSAMITNKIAHYSADSVKGKLMVESAVDTAVALINMNQSDSDWTVDGFCSVGKDNDNMSHIEVHQMDGSKLVDSSSASSVRWNYIHYNYRDENNHLKSKIIGRFAFLALGTSGSIDPSACVTHESDKNPNWNVDGAQDEVDGSNVNQRYGVHVYEMNIAALDPDHERLSKDMVKRLSSKKAGGELVDGGRWTDFPTMFTKIGMYNELDKKKCQEEWMVLNTDEDLEKFYEAGDIDSSSPPTKDRFNLRKFTDKDGDGIYTKGADENWWDSLDNKVDLGLTIPYLSALNGTKLNPRTFPDSSARQDQIIANLIDYCDTDSIPTSDVECDNWGASTPPTFTGNEESSYISEVAVGVDAVATTHETTDGAGNTVYQYDYNVSAYLNAEEVNMYGSNIGNKAIICIDKGSITFSYKKPDGTTFDGPELSLDGKEIEIKDANKRCPARTYINKAYDASSITDSAGPFYSSTSFTPQVTAHIKITYVRLKQKLDGVEKNRDFSKVNADISKDIDLGNGQGDTTVEKTQWFAWEVDDPRQNLNPGDWSEDDQLIDGSHPDYTDSAVITVGSPNKKTSFEKSASNGDREQQVTAPTRTGGGVVSTAYIRNDLMKSPWELGCIHRGAKWETINLCKYNTSSEYLGSYYQGDARILDQIKMTSDLKCWGKFNLNATASDSLRVLTYGIHIPSEVNDDVYKDPLSGPKIDKDTADAIAGVIQGKLGKFQRRGEVANQLLLFKWSGEPDNFNNLMPDGVDDTNAAREALIGKFINLCKAKKITSTTVNLIVIAQAIKDIGGRTIYKDLDYDGQVGNADETACGWDCNGDGYIGGSTVSETIDTEEDRYDLNGDLILSEAKAWATLSLDPNDNKWKISRLIFMDE